MSNKPEYKKRDDHRGGRVSDYQPLIALVSISFLAACAITWHTQAYISDWMHYFMGLFLCSFAMLKIFNLSGFADGFQMYDIIAKKERFYAYLYPFLELMLGLAYLAFIFPLFTYGVTIILMFISAVGVLKALRKGLDINCPCMGSILKVPLSTVTLIEDLGMGFMALGMFISAI